MTHQQAIGELVLLKAIMITIRFRRLRRRIFKALRLKRKAELEARIILDTMAELGRRSRAASREIYRDREAAR